MKHAPFVTLQRTKCAGRLPKFTGRPDAIQWAVAQGAFVSIGEAIIEYDALCKTYTGLNVYPFWIREVGRKLNTLDRANRARTKHDSK